VGEVRWRRGLEIYKKKKWVIPFGRLRNFGPVASRELLPNTSAAGEV
jgi:hypothetical protein